MKGIGDKVWDELIRKSTTQRRGWGVMEFLEADGSYHIVEAAPMDRGWSRVVVLKPKPSL